MIKVSMRCIALFVLLIPALVSAGSLDDYYLSRLAPQHARALGFSGVVAQQPVQAERCLTGIRHSAKTDWKKLESSTQKILSKVLARPSLSGERTCTPAGGHFTIHYATSGGDAPDPTDANQNGVPDWVEKVAGVFEYVYYVEVNKMGYRPPPVSTYNVYLEDLTSSRAYGFTTDDGLPSRSGTSASSYIEIDKAFTDSMFERTASGFYTPEQSLRVTAAHEFHHAIQYGYNYYFDIWYAEVTSTWMEDEVYDSVNQLYSYLPSYLPRAGTLSLNAPMDGGSEYGRWIFNRCLAELHGSRTIVRNVWEQLSTMPAPADGSDIAMLPVIDTVLNGGLGNHFFRFAKRLFLQDWLSHLGDIRLIGSVVPSVSSAVNGTVQAPINAQANPFTFTYYKYIPSSIDGHDLTITFPNLPSNLAVSAFKSDSTGINEYQYNGDTQTILIPAFSSDAVVYLLICNNGGDMQAPLSLSFPADASSQLDGSALDANTLVIPPQTPVNNTTSGGTSNGKSGCFIATAAYGSYLHPKVALLRAFRDDYLLTNPPGRLFVALYYRVSPPIADLIARHESLKVGTRLLLAPVVLAVEHCRVAFLLLCIGLAVPIVRRMRVAPGKSLTTEDTEEN